MRLSALQKRGVVVVEEEKSVGNDIGGEFNRKYRKRPPSSYAGGQILRTDSSWLNQVLPGMLSLPLQKAEIIRTTAGLRGDALALLPGASVEDVGHLVELRTAALNSVASAEGNIDNLAKYASQLISIVPRLEGYEAELRLELNWGAAFSVDKQLTSGLAVQQNRKTIEGLKLSFKYFQMAAGALSFCKDMVAPRIKGAVFPHLTDIGLQFALNVMLAQAQAAFYLKAVADREAGSTSVTPGIIAKLASQVALFYTRSFSFAKQAPVKDILDASWLDVLQIEMKCYDAYAEQYQAALAKDTALKTASGYGEEIARLNKAIATLKEVDALLVKKHANLQVLREEPALVLKQLELKLRDAVKDNNTVYLDRVPELASLPHIEGVVMAKPVDPLAAASTGVLFKGVIPKEVRMFVSAYSGRVQSLVASSVAEANQATNISRALLSDVGLPGSLETYKAEGVLSDNLWGKIARIQALGGIADLRKRQVDVDSKAARASGSLESIASAIERERKDDREFRDKYPTSGVSSAIVLQEVSAALGRLRESFASARMTDGALADLLNEADFTSYMALLARPRAEIAAMLPGVSSGGGKVDTGALEGTLVALGRLLDQREAAIRHLTKLADSDVTEEALRRMSAGETSDKIQRDLIAQCDGAAEAIKATLVSQHALLDAVLNANQAFVSARNHDPRATEMDRAVARIEQSISRFYSAQSQLSEGLTFYSNLQVRISSLSQSLDDSCYAQHMQRQDVEAQVALQYSRQSQERVDSEMARRVEEQLRLTNSCYGLPSAPSVPQQYGYPSFEHTPVPQYAPALPPPSYTYQHTASVVSGAALDDAKDDKVARLVEMGFRREDVVEQLRKYSGDERSALNALLGL